jgi:Chaperone of endosialidase
VMVPRLGGTITGPLTLSTAPTATLHAATKSYVDTGDAARLPLTGGTLTGALTVQGNVTTTGSVSATGNISTSGSFTTSFSGAATQGQVVFGNAGRRLYFNGGDMWDFNGKVHATGLVLSAGQAVYYEDSQAVWSIWESGHVRFSHQIKTPTISVDWLQNTSGGSPQLKTADGRGIVFQFVDDYANYVRFFRNDGFTNYLMQSPNMRYMDARDWGGTWAMLVQQNDGGNQIFFPAAYSDERLKTDIRPTQVDALAAIAAVEVVEYDWTEEGLTHARRAPDRQRVKIGVVAQRVQQQIPEMVLHQPEQAATDAMGATPATWNIKPDEAVPYLIRAIQQQQELIVALTARLATLEAATSAGGGNALSFD